MAAREAGDEIGEMGLLLEARRLLRKRFVEGKNEADRR